MSPSGQSRGIVSSADEAARLGSRLAMGAKALGVVGTATTFYDEMTREGTASPQNRIANVAVSTGVGAATGAAAVALATGAGACATGIGCLVGAPIIAGVAAFGTLHYLRRHDGWYDGPAPPLPPRIHPDILRNLDYDALTD